MVTDAYKKKSVYSSLRRRGEHDAVSFVNCRLFLPRAGHVGIAPHNMGCNYFYPKNNRTAFLASSLGQITLVKSNNTKLNWPKQFTKNGLVSSTSLSTSNRDVTFHSFALKEVKKNTRIVRSGSNYQDDLIFSRAILTILTSLNARHRVRRILEFHVACVLTEKLSRTLRTLRSGF